MKILMISPEVAPYVKVGGLADVAGALPKALAALGHDVRVVCPLYGSVRQEPSWTALPAPLDVRLGGGVRQARVWQTAMGRPPALVYFLEYHEYYARPEVYAGPWGDHKDNPQRFTFLCRAALDLCHALEWYPDVVHGHDWSAGLAHVYLNHNDLAGPLRHSASVFTIHNLQHQGMSPRATLDYAGLPASVFHPENVESLGSVNMLKAGLYNATKLTTVSPTYADEIQGEEHGWGLHPVLRYRSGDLIGILNGCDTEEWNPATDELIPARYGPGDLGGKAACKQALQAQLGLAQDPSVPLFGVVSRLWHQKGLDLLAHIGPQLFERMRLQLVLLGSGDKALERSFRTLAERYPDRMAFAQGYNNALSHGIYAGQDFFIMPSRFEPCGLGQMYAMLYGAPPVVRATGGLLDTVQQYVQGSGLGTGFLFRDPTPEALYNTLGWAVATWYDRREDYLALQQRAMRQDFTWDKSARAYEDVYRWAVEVRRHSFGQPPPPRPA